MDRPIVFFDGVCNFCHATVRFIIDRDPKDRFRFSSLQSTTAQHLLAPYGLKANNLDTFVLLSEGKLYTKSTAALRISRRLRPPWPLLWGLIIVPRPIRDWFYGFIARRRYRWFGKNETCDLPSMEDRQRFL